jgi:hypothetical protein
VRPASLPEALGACRAGAAGAPSFAVVVRQQPSHPGRRPASALVMMAGRAQCNRISYLYNILIGLGALQIFCCGARQWAAAGH